MSGLHENLQDYFFFPSFSSRELVRNCPVKSKIIHKIFVNKMWYEDKQGVKQPPKQQQQQTNKQASKRKQ